MKRLILCLWAVVCLGCVGLGLHLRSVSVDVEGDATATTTADPVLMVMSAPEIEAPKLVEPEELESTPDPYAEHDSWCEDLYKMNCECPARDPVVCKAPKEPCPLDRSGHVQECRRPGWAIREDSNAYQCMPKWLNRAQRQKQRESIRLIVGELCEPPRWAKDLSAWGKNRRMGTDPSKLCWHLPGRSKTLKQCMGKHFCQPDKLVKLLALVAFRESTMMHDTIHELNLDVEANRDAYAKAQKRGWYEGNPHFTDIHRWSQGYGWYGFNAALHVFYWDRKAPPEILCRQVESTEVYLRKARKAFQKLWGMYGDHTMRVYTLDTGEKVTVKGVTWYDLHRAASSGKLYPEKVIKTRRWSKKKEKWIKVGFVSRARSKKVRLDPFETVMFEMLGKPIPRHKQNQVAEKIREQIRQHFDRQAANDSQYTKVAASG